MEDHVGLYVLLGILGFAALYLAYIYTRDFGAKSAYNIGGLLFLGAVITTSIYKQAARSFYPGHAQIFQDMDNFVFGTAAFLFVAWIVGVFLGEWIESRATREREQYKKAFPNIEFKAGESVNESLHKYVDS